MALIMVISVFTIIPISASAKKMKTGFELTAGLDNESMTVTGTNSLGSMISAKYEEDADEIQNNGSTIYSVEVEGKTAKVDLRALSNAKLVVSIFDEEGVNMYGSGMAEVTPDDSIVDISLNISSMPQYFYIKAFLLDESTNLPLCKQYENNYYTQDMQEFFAKTIDDFDAEKVLNLDDSQEDNFLVYNDDTIIIENTDENTNVVTQADDNSKEYVIENIDGTISSLKSGDIFSYDFGDGNLLIIKIDTITITGTTAVINGDELELQEAFDYIKIDTTSYSDDATVDNSDLEDGITYDGKVEDTDETAGFEETTGKKELAPTGWTITDETFESSDTFKYTFAKDELNNPSETLRYKLSGSVSFKFSINVKVFFDIDIFQGNTVEFSFSLKYKLGVTFELELKGKLPPWKLGYFALSPCPGIFISFTPSVILEGKLTAKTSVSIEGQLGFKFKNGNHEDLYKPPTVNTKIEFEGELFVGISLEPKIGIVADAATASMEVLAGFRIKAKIERSDDTHSYLDNNEDDNDKDEIHLCSSCLDGDISFVCELNFKLSIFNNPDLTWKFDVYKFEQKLGDFYYSFDTNTFDWTKCPNHKYKVTVTVLDPKHKPIPEVLINNEKSTDDNGIVKIYLRAGDISMTLEKDGKEAHRNAYISKAGRITFTIDFEYPDSIESNQNTIQKRTVLDSGKCGAKAFYVYYADGTLVVGGSETMANYHDNVYHGDPPWYEYRQDIRRVLIGNGITSIGFSNFQGCINLESVSIGNGVERISAYAFCECTNLKDLVIPANVSSIGYDAFGGCKALESAIIVNSIIGTHAFTNCDSLKTVVLGNGVTTIEGWAFQNCTSLESITIPKNIESINGYAFKGCTALKSVVLENGVATIQSYAFQDCTKLESITIPDSVTSLGNYAFDNCSSLCNVVLGSGLTSIPVGAFNNCINLITVSGGKEVTNIGEKAFYKCTNLISVPYWNKLTSIDRDAFYNCTSIKRFTIADGVIDIKANAFQGCSDLESVEFGSGLNSIGYGAFSGCKKLKRIIIPESVSAIGSSSFGACSSLESVTITSGSIGTYAFSNCENLKTVVLGNGVTKIDSWAFQYCTSLESITIPGSVTDIGNDLFKGCTNLKVAVIEEGVPILANNEFEKCPNLESVTIPFSVKSIGYYTFNDCKKLKDIYYYGSEEGWNNITKSDGNAPLQSATIHYLVGDGIVPTGLFNKIDTDSIGLLSNDYHNQPDCLLLYSSILPSEITENQDISSTERKNPIIASGTNYEISTAAEDDNTIIHEHLVPGTQALFVVLAGDAESAELSSDTLLYINQATVDDDGKVDFQVQSKFTSKSYSSYIIGQCMHSSTSWFTQVESSDEKDGMKVLVCNDCGEAIDSETIGYTPTVFALGDVDGDGEVTIIDATAIQRHLANIPTFAYNEATADTDGDGEVTIIDATYIQRWLASLPSNDSIGKPIS